VAKPRELAIKILENDKAWTPERIDAAMHKGTENSYVLKNKIPVYIGYFTAVVKDDGQIYFYKDVYERDERLANLLFKEE
jgi:L,D-transpeptidase YcbB